MTLRVNITMRIKSLTEINKNISVDLLVAGALSIGRGVVVAHYHLALTKLYLLLLLLLMLLNDSLMLAPTNTAVLVTGASATEAGS